MECADTLPRKLWQGVGWASAHPVVLWAKLFRQREPWAKSLQKGQPRPVIAGRWTGLGPQQAAGPEAAVASLAFPLRDRETPAGL